MPAMANGTPGGALTHLVWTKSRRSGPTGNCVELARLPQGCGIGVRNSRDPLGPVLIYTDAEIEALILGVKDGDFDHLLAQPTAG